MGDVILFFFLIWFASICAIRGAVAIIPFFIDLSEEHIAQRSRIVRNIQIDLVIILIGVVIILWLSDV